MSDDDSTTTQIEEEHLKTLVDLTLTSIDIMYATPEIADRKGQNQAMHYLGESMDSVLNNVHELEQDCEPVKEAVDKLADEAKEDLNMEELQEAIEEKVEKTEDTEDSASYFG